MDQEKRDRSQRDRSDRVPRTESEERRRRERRREREERHRLEKERIRNGEQPSSAARKSRKGRNLDLIDKLDHTGIYGQGCEFAKSLIAVRSTNILLVFHHDGPFDACNPHRNAKKDRRAPMQAFPEGSANMALGGAGPLHSRLDLDKFHGRTGDAFTDYNVTKKADTSMSTADHQREYRRHFEPPRNQQPQFVHPTDKVEQVHGEESYGLGTSTFLDGAPASRSALQRRESEEQSAMLEGGGLQRKKSLAQRLRGMSNSRPTRYGGGELRSPEARYNNGFNDQAPLAGDRIPAASTQSAGGPARAIYTRENEVNPYEDAFEKKGAEIKFAEQEKPLPSSPGKANGSGLTRSVTADNAIRTSTEDEGKPSFLTRMKSLKGGRRARPERKDSNTVVT